MAGPTVISFKKDTPTVVATSFCVEALIESYKITNNNNVLNVALSSADFVLKDLSRTQLEDGFLFSYSVTDGNNTVINASLLGAKFLSYSFKYNKNKEHLDAAKKAVIAGCRLQESDGSWVYGLLSIQNWKDSFHTGFNLDALKTFQENTGDKSFQNNLDSGWDYYIKTFFESDGRPKYYHNKTYPIDIHCPGQLIITASKIKQFKNYQHKLTKTMDWTIENMQSKKGYFYYQLKKVFSSKIPYMRWSNAFMFNAMAHFYLESQK